jgi:hypothetical protein
MLSLRNSIVRNALNPLVFKIFNLTFIAIAQNILLLVAELPQYLLLTNWIAGSKHVNALAKLKPHHAATKHVPLNIADVALAVLFIATLAFEMRAVRLSLPFSFLPFLPFHLSLSSSLFPPYCFFFLL